MTNIQKKAELSKSSPQNAHALEYGTTTKKKKDYLSSLSNDLRLLVEIDEAAMIFFKDCLNINQMLVKYYKKKYNVKELDSFLNWKEKGYKLKKGSKGFLIWTAPKKHTIKIEFEAIEQTKTENEEFTKESFFISHLFSDLQVEPIK